ncbi:serine hydrolase [Nonomuraea fuscirosea]|uniref:serine hydrolase n=1 Tax=Nonomuraea fuscirosea TaxID=1291556 RepID=UPI003432C9D8
MVTVVARAILRLVVVLALVLPLALVNWSQEPAGISVAAVPRAGAMQEAAPEIAGASPGVVPETAGVTPGAVPGRAGATRGAVSGPERAGAAPRSELRPAPESELGPAREAGNGLARLGAGSLARLGVSGLARIGVDGLGRVGVGGLGDTYAGGQSNVAVASVGREAVSPVPAERVSARLDRFLQGRPGPVSAMVKDLATGRVYRYHAGERLITASTAKVQILVALLLRTPWKKLPAEVRRDAEMMIRYSDNHAADRLWARIGGADGFNRAGRRLGLKDTVGVPGQCVDLYCWGITRTSVDDQIRLMAALVSGESPLKAGDRAQVRKLMGEVVDGQNWGVSAAACDEERVALKNGWLKRVSTKRWATISVGLIRDGDGRDYALAVLTEGSPEVESGIATVEGVVERIMRDFRDCRA